MGRVPDSLKLIGWRITLGLIIAGAVWVAWSRLQQYDPVTTCTRQCTVVNVGGCNRDGECGVSCTQGGFDRGRFPVVGQTFCSEWTTEFKERK